MAYSCPSLSETFEADIDSINTAGKVVFVLI